MQTETPPTPPNETPTEIQTEFNPVPAPEDKVERIRRDENAKVTLQAIASNNGTAANYGIAAMVWGENHPAGNLENLPDTMPAEMNAGDLCDNLRMVLDSIRTLGEVEKLFKKMRYAIEGEIVRHLNEQGIEKLSGSRLNVTLSTKTYAQYAPEDFEKIVKGLVDEGNAHTLYWNFSAKKLQEMFDAGGRFPEGLTLGEKENVTTRRVGG